MEKTGLAISIVVVIVISVYLDEAQGRREEGGGFRSGGGRGGGGRGGSSRSRSAGWKASLNSQGRGTSKFSDKTWLQAALNGTIYNGQKFVDQNPDRKQKPTICYNSREKRPDSSPLNYFICPKPGEGNKTNKGGNITRCHDDVGTYSFCCGDDGEQYCCSEKQAEEFYKAKSSNYGITALEIVLLILVFGFEVLLVSAVLVGFSLYYCYKRWCKSACNWCKSVCKRRLSKKTALRESSCNGDSAQETEKFTVATV